jgi:hypothetical protein
MDFCTVPLLALNLSSIRNLLRKKNMAPTKDDIPADTTTAFQPTNCAPSEYSPPIKKPGIGDETDQSPSPQSCDSTDMEDSRRSEDSGYFTELSWRNTSSSDRGSLSPLDYSPPSKRARDRDTDTDKDDMKNSSLLSTDCIIGDSKTYTPLKSSGKDDYESCHVTKDLEKRLERTAVSSKVGIIIVIWSDFRCCWLKMNAYVA